LSALHHTGYDRNLLRIDPVSVSSAIDGQIHIAAAVLKQHDGPTLEQAIKLDSAVGPEQTP